MKFSNKDKILVVAAHPDDEILGCAGTLDKAIKKKSKVKVIYIGEGVSARFPIGQEYSKESLKAKKIREVEAIKALKILNIKDYKFGSKLCTKFDKYPLSEIILEIENVIRKFKPNIIFSHNDRDLNIDHRIIHSAVMTAVRPGHKSSIKQVYSFEIPCSSNWIYDEKFNPNTYVDISKNLKIKQKAFAAYKNETKPFPFPRSKIGIDVLAKFRGMQSGLLCAEAFQ